MSGNCREVNFIACDWSFICKCFKRAVNTVFVCFVFFFQCFWFGRELKTKSKKHEQHLMLKLETIRAQQTQIISKKLFHMPALPIRIFWSGSLWFVSSQAIVSSYFYAKTGKSVERYSCIFFDFGEIKKHKTQRIFMKLGTNSISRVLFNVANSAFPESERYWNFKNKSTRFTKRLDRFLSFFIKIWKNDCDDTNQSEPL